MFALPFYCFSGRASLCSEVGGSRDQGSSGSSICFILPKTTVEQRRWGYMWNINHKVPHLGSPVTPKAISNLYLKHSICCFRALLSGLPINQHAASNPSHPLFYNPTPFQKLKMQYKIKIIVLCQSLKHHGIKWDAKM